MIGDATHNVIVLNTLDAIEQAIVESQERKDGSQDEFDTEQPPVIWEMAVSAGIEASERGDSSRWMIGDLALLIEWKYGENSIDKFAKAIKVEVGRVREYNTVCHFWNRKSSARAELLDTCPNIFYSHFRAAMRLKDPSAARRCLLKASERDWSVEWLQVFINRCLCKPKPPKKLVDLTLPIEKLDRCRLIFDLPTPDAQKLIDHAYEGRPVRLVIYEGKE